jgi:hypothetical protein
VAVLEGYVDVIRSFQVRGWAFNPESPDARLTITLRVAGEPILTDSASLFREDLLQSGKGDGRHGFILNVDRRLPTDRPQLIQVEVGQGSGQVEALPHSAAAVQDEAPSRIQGYFERTGPLEIAGWAYDPLQPDDHLTVNVFVDGQPVGTLLANQFRQDLAAAQVGKGDHGFTLHLSEDLPEDPAVYEAVAILANGMPGSLGYLWDPDGSPDGKPRPARAPSGEYEQTPLTFIGHSEDQAQRPVFILGAARSGTSAVAQALVRTTDYVGHAEGHLLELIQPMLRLVTSHYNERGDEWRFRQNTMIAQVPISYLEDGVRHVFVELGRALFPKGRWLDKTPRPAMIVAAPLLRRVWPEARFIFMKRRGIENIISRMTKFPTVSFEDHCHDWARTMESWMTVRDSLKGVAIEIDQLFLATRPEDAARGVADLLGLLPAELSGLAQDLRLDHPERTAEHFGSVTTFNLSPWSAEQRDAFMRICGRTMDFYGYSMDDKYYLPGHDGLGLSLV